MARHLLASLLLLCLSPSRARAKPLVVVIPTGEGDAIIATADVARALAGKIEHEGQVRARLGYSIPDQLQAAVKAKKAHKALKKAARAFQQLDFEAVRKGALRALKVFKKQIKLGGPSDDYVQTLHLLAAAELFDGKEGAAKQAMADAVLFDRKPPPLKKYSPTVQALHGKVLTDESLAGTLEVSSRPPGLLWSCGRLVGSTRQQAKLRAGLHLLRVFRSGRAVWTRWVRIAFGSTKRIAIALEKSPVGEAPQIAALRKEARAGAPGSAVSVAASEHDADQVALVSAGTPCSDSRCPVMLRWAKGTAWVRRGEAVLGAGADASAVAEQLLGKAPAKKKQSTSAASQTTSEVRHCTDDSQCFLDHRCMGGICKKVVPITRKWWFWTLIGVAAAGVAAAIAIPLTLPSGPVIEVR